METITYLVKKISQFKTTNDSSYLILDLISSDKSRIRGVIWKPDEVMEDDEEFIHEDAVYIFGADEQIYKGDKQLNIYYASEVDVDKSIFCDDAVVDVDSLMERLMSVLVTVKTPAYRYIIKSILSGNFMENIKSLPKTPNYDYSYPGGLLQNIVYMVELSNFIANVMLQDNMDTFESSRDLLICSALVCDIGKATEMSLSYFKLDESESDLLGHQYLSCLFLSELDKKCDYKYHSEITNVKHCVLSHHSTDYNNWSPIKIKLKEAELLRHIVQLVFKSGEWNLKYK